MTNNVLGQRGGGGIFPAKPNGSGVYIQCLLFRWVFYTGILVYGFFCLWDKPWFWNIRHCWYDYPYHQVGTSSR